MTPPRIVGFSGKAGAGKTSAALILVAMAGYARLSFAAPLRDMLLAIGLTAEDLSEGKAIPHLLLGGKTPRFALQTLGTDWGRRTICNDIWLGIARHRMQQALSTGESVCFDDVRFANEAAMIRSLGGLVVNVERPGSPDIAPDHASEVGLPSDMIDHRISATDLAGLRSQLLAIINPQPA
jgi:hypothetical protein